MKKKKTLFVAALVIVSAITVVVGPKRETARPAVRQALNAEREEKREPTEDQARSGAAPTREITKSYESVPSPPPPNKSGPATASAPGVTPQVTQPAGSREELMDPLARVALSLVGADPAAEQYWVAAIFDPSLSDREREDLMEDLNEDGLSDPRQGNPEDLPLIVNRLALIEEIAPFADQFMLEHLGEAYKDLWNLANGRRAQ